MIMKPSRPSVIGAIAIALVLASSAIGLAQNQAQPATQNTPPPSAPPDPRIESPLRLEVVLSRLDAKGAAVSRMPYVFSATSAPPGNNCRLRMGAQIPLSNGEYRSIGTNIDCQVRPMPGNSFQIVISIDESSILGDDADPNTPPKLGGFPIFRSYQSTNTVLLRSGESARFTTAADRVSGETVVAEVTLTVVK